MTQEEFNAMLEVAISQGLFGYYTSKYSGEEMDGLLDWVNGQMNPDEEQTTNITV